MCNHLISALNIFCITFSCSHTGVSFTATLITVDDFGFFQRSIFYSCINSSATSCLPHMCNFEYWSLGRNWKHSKGMTVNLMHRKQAHFLFIYFLGCALGFLSCCRPYTPLCQSGCCRCSSSPASPPSALYAKRTRMSTEKKQKMQQKKLKKWETT